MDRKAFPGETMAGSSSLLFSSEVHGPDSLRWNKRLAWERRTQWDTWWLGLIAEPQKDQETGPSNLGVSTSFPRPGEHLCKDICEGEGDRNDHYLSGPRDPESQCNQQAGRLIVTDRSRRRGVEGASNPAIRGCVMPTVTWGP